MKNVKLYQKTVNLLLDAYNDGELEHGSCTACAVGNICKEVAEQTGIFGGNWASLFMTRSNDGVFKQSPFTYANAKTIRDGEQLVSLAPYSQEELMKIEYAFESSIHYSNKGYDYYADEDKKKGQFIGLCAVLDVLKEIHEVKEDAHKESVTKLNNVYETIS